MSLTGWLVHPDDPPASDEPVGPLPHGRDRAKILAALESPGSLRQLAERVGVSERTARRHVDVLHAAGAVRPSGAWDGRQVVWKRATDPETR